jgi:surface antigen
MLRFVLLALAGSALSACGSTRGPVPAGYGYEAGDGYQSCVPYARARSGLDLRGDGWQWWEAALGRYDRGQQPRPGAVLVFQRTPRLRDGHVAVVARVLGPREIRVDHANLASGGLKGRVARDQAVIDVSARNDWTEVRVWYPPAGVVGNTVFPAYGFILPARRWAGLE